MQSFFKYFVTICVVGASLYLVPMFIDRPLGFGKDNVPEQILLASTISTATSTGVTVSSYQNVGFTVSTVNTSGTIKFGCSMADSLPTFATLPTASNRWQYVDVIDLQDEASIDGNTGITFAQSTTIRQVAIRNNVFKHCGAFFTTAAANVGSTTVRIVEINNL